LLKECSWLLLNAARFLPIFIFITGTWFDAKTADMRDGRRR